MKKITLLLVAALMAVTGAVAQSKVAVQTHQNRVSAIAQKQAKVKPSGQKARPSVPNSHKADNLVIPAQAQSRLASLMERNLPKMLKSPRKAGAADIIYDQPEGTQILYARSGVAYFTFFGYVYSSEISEAIGNVVIDGNTMYIKNLISQAGTNTWVKGTIDGNKVTFKFPQPISYNTYYDTTLSARLLVLNNDWYVPSANQTVTFDYDTATGTIKPSSTGLNNGRLVIGAVWDDDDTWSGQADYAFLFEKITSEPVAAPEGLTREKYGLSAPAATGYFVDVAFQGNDVYVFGIDSNLPEACVKGTIDGDKVTFKSGQYLGADEVAGYHMYLMSATEEEVYDEDDDYTYVDYKLNDNDITFTYDAATKSLSNGSTFLVNQGKSVGAPLFAFTGGKIKKFEDVAATPSPVDEYSFDGANYIRSYGYGYLDFDIPNCDVNGDLLDTEKLYYKVYYGDSDNAKPFIFSPEEYETLEEPLTEVPYLLNNGEFNARGAEHSLTFYVNFSTNIGLQTVYYGGGERRESEIVWYGNNNGVAGFESVFPLVADAEVNSPLAEGDIAMNLGTPAYGFNSGSRQTETYSVAMKIADGFSAAHLTGMKVKAISVPFLSTAGLSNTKVWLSTSLELNADGTFTPNLTSKDFTVKENGFTTVMLDQAYEIPEDGIYIGYTFTHEYDYDAESDDNTPVVLTGYTSGGFMIFSDKVYRLGWATLTGEEGDLALEAVLTGGQSDAAEFNTIYDAHLAVNTTGEAQAEIVNFGYNGLQSISTNYKLLGDGIEKNGQLDVDGIGLPRVFGAYKVVPLDVPASPITVDCVYYTDVETANGKANPIDDNEAQCNVFVVNFLPKKRPLMEEYTGTWCGYCPRGYVGLEKMAELYPEDFIALSYHNGDPMEVMEDYMFPNEVDGFPAAFIDRTKEVDAYHGDGEDDFGIEPFWKNVCTEFGTADIDVEASWTEDESAIRVKSTAKFPRSEESAGYTMSYAVVADGLTGTGDDWAQANYYAGGTYGSPLYMDQFSSTDESRVAGLVFNDVIVAAEEAAVTLPETITADEAYPGECTFQAKDIVNTAGAPVIQDKSKVKVVAILLDAFGKVMNVNRCKVAVSTAIHNVNAGAADNVARTTYYDLSGRKVLLPETGVYLRTIEYKDGHSVSSKVVMK